MFSSRIRIGLAIATFTVAVAMPAAALGSTGATKAPPDWIERYAAAQVKSFSFPPENPDWIERYALAHRHPVLTTMVDGRSPDTLDAASAAQQRQQQIMDGRSPDTMDAATATQQGEQQITDGRSPDTRDAAAAVQPIEIVTSGAFHWSDAGIGAGVGAGLLALSGMLAVSISAHRRSRVHTA